MEKENAVDTTVPTSFFGLPDYAMNPGFVKKTFYAVCSLRNIDFCMLFDKQELEQSKALSSPWNFVLADLPYKARSGRNDETTITGSLPLLN